MNVAGQCEQIKRGVCCGVEDDGSGADEAVEAAGGFDEVKAESEFWCGLSTIAFGSQTDVYGRRPSDRGKEAAFSRHSSCGIVDTVARSNPRTPSKPSSLIGVMRSGKII